MNKGTFAEVNAVSCAPDGSCAIGGNYADRSGFSQAFVADEHDGVWGKAIEVPGLAALNTNKNAFVFSVSCVRAGACAAGGGFADHHGQQGFVVVERNGRWGKAIEPPGLAALNAGGSAAVFSVSCAPAGACAAGGGYDGPNGNSKGFVVNQTR